MKEPRAIANLNRNNCCQGSVLLQKRYLCRRAEPEHLDNDLTEIPGAVPPQ